MKDLLDYANVQAALDGAAIFETAISSEPLGKPDVFVLPTALMLAPPELPDGWRNALIEHHEAGGILVSVCSGAFLLAETGLLDGRQVTTHWRHAAALKQRHPQAIINTDRILVDLGSIVTAGGVMAWTDLTLHMIQRFGGRRLMLDVARMFLMDPPEREQKYYATFVPNMKHSDQAIATIQRLMQADLSVAHSVASLAGTGAMSERSFMRRFKRATGETPVAYLQLLRVEAARSRLEMTRDSFEQISWDLGYGDTAAFRRVFKRVCGLTPSDYRRRFGMVAGSFPAKIQPNERHPSDGQ
ncbi:MAG: GlxA family transcriptional regulator [Shimia sp.]|uniref:GlxA family transcriptional regulator n=1 Tax=Shimia sp. TaxID=1954381 RepID=UPI004059379B